MRVYAAKLVLVAALAGLLVAAESRSRRSAGDESAEDASEEFEQEDAHASREGDVAAATSATVGSLGGAAAGGATGASQSAGKARERPDMWSSMTGGLSDMIKYPLTGQPNPKGHEGAGKALASLFGMPAALGAKKLDAGSALKGDQSDAGKEVGLNQRSLSDWLQLILNPLEFTKAISVHFKLSQEKLIERLGKGLVFGLEAMLHPLVCTIKIVEKVFVPDACRLKFICQMGSHLELIRATALKLSPSLLEGSAQLKAFSEGVAGKDCSSVFPNCEPKLRKPFEELKSVSSGAPTTGAVAATKAY